MVRQESTGSHNLYISGYFVGDEKPKSSASAWSPFALCYCVDHPFPHCWCPGIIVWLPGNGIAEVKELGRKSVDGNYLVSVGFSSDVEVSLGSMKIPASKLPKPPDGSQCSLEDLVGTPTVDSDETILRALQAVARSDGIQTLVKEITRTPDSERERKVIESFTPESLRARGINLPPGATVSVDRTAHLGFASLPKEPSEAKYDVPLKVCLGAHTPIGSIYVHCFTWTIKVVVPWD